MFRAPFHSHWNALSAMTITQIGYHKWPGLSSEAREILGKLLFSRIFATYAQAVVRLHAFIGR